MTRSVLVPVKPAIPSNLSRSRIRDDLLGPKVAVARAVDNATALERNSESVFNRIYPKPPLAEVFDRFHRVSARAAETKVLKSREPDVRAVSELLSSCCKTGEGKESF